MKFPALLVAFLATFTVFAQDGRDATYLAARDAFRTGDRARLDRAAALIGNHELAPYVENYQLRMTMDQGDSPALRAFLERHDGTYVAEKLRADWIRWLGKRGNWAEIVVEYPRLIAPEPDVTCWSQQARLAGGDKAALDEARQLWLTMLEPPEPCRPVLESLVRDNRVTTDDVWTRARRQFEANRTGPAKLTLAALPAAQAPDAKALDMVIGSPMGYLARQPPNWHASQTGRELAVLAIQRIAANDPRAAAAELEKIQGRLQEPERLWAWSQIGLQGAKRHYGEALAWYAQARETPLSDEAAQWKVRAALRAHDWSVVLATISEMPPG
jgi:soluble lytic murein transglycosylase